MRPSASIKGGSNENGAQSPVETDDARVARLSVFDALNADGRLENNNQKESTTAANLMWCPDISLILPPMRLVTFYPAH
jgi:hypothetical protein